MKDFSFQGRIELAERRPDGRPGAFIWVGDQSSCELTLNTENADRTETYSGQRLQSARMRTGTTVEGNIVLRYFTPDNVKLGLYATEQTVVGASVTGEVISGTGVGALGVGKRFGVSKPWGITALTVKDSATPTPATLLTGQVDPANDEYVLESANTGIIRLLKAGTPAFTAPLKADYTHVGFKNMPLFTADPPERWLRLNGINTVTGERLVTELYKVQFNPFASLPFINDEFGELPLSFTALFDSDKADDPSLGGFGRIQLLS